MNKFFNQNGLAAILTVVIISAISIIAIKFVSWQAITDLDISFLGEKTGELNSIAGGCLEEALGQLSIDWDYTINDQTVDIGLGSCIYSIEISGTNREINLTAQIDNKYFKNLAVMAEKSQKIRIKSYNIVSD